MDSDAEKNRPVSDSDSQSVLEAGDVEPQVHTGEKSYGMF